MARNLVVLACVAVLTLTFGVTSFAGGECDLTDLDGVCDSMDNCDEDPNGPLLGSCSAQEDGDGDGFGNACDTDTNNNGQTDLGDVSDTLAESKISGTLLNYDFDCDGQTSLSDVSQALGDSKASKIPGPSCDNPVGTPCP